MPIGLTRSPRLEKGAFIKLSLGFLGPEFSRIKFQYNPETLSRTVTPSSGSVEQGERVKTEATDEPFDPDEKISLTLELDATDGLEDSDNHPDAVEFGIAPQIAAIESLLYPTDISLIQDILPDFITEELPDFLQEALDFVLRCRVPIVLFEHGPRTNLPVRLTSFSVEETLHSPKLFPIQAKVSVEMQVITGRSLDIPFTDISAVEKLAVTAYRLYRRRKLDIG